MQKPRSVHSVEYKMLASQLRAAREDAGLTQRALAARLGKLQSYVHKVETCEREINVIELIDYCSALKIDAVTFFNELLRTITNLRKS